MSQYEIRNLVTLVATIGFSAILFLEPATLAINVVRYAAAGYVVFMSVALAYSGVILLERSKRTVAYSAAMAYQMSQKKYPAVSNVLWRLPLPILAGSFMLTSHIVIGASLALVWACWAVQRNVAIRFWHRLDEETQRELFEAIDTE